MKVILPTCLCCETETWLSLLLEAGVGNVLEDLIVTLAKEGGGRRELQRYQDFRLQNQMKYVQEQHKKIISDLAIKCASVIRP